VTTPGTDDLTTGNGARRGPELRTVMLVFLSLTYLLGYFDRLLLVVVAELIKHEFMLSDRQLSLLTGASFVIIYGLIGIAGGWLVDKYSRKVILIGALTLWSLMTIAGGFARSFAHLAIARAGLGIGQAVNVPAAMSLISDMYPPGKRPLAIAIFYTGGMVGVLASFLLGSWVAVQYGWRTAFLAAGPPGILLAILMAFLVREPARERPSSAATATPMQENPFALIWRNRPLKWLIVAGGVSSFANIGMMQWLPMFFIRSHGLSQADIGLFFGPVLAAGNAAGIMLGGWLGNRLASSTTRDLVRFCTWTMIALVPVYLIMLWVTSLPLALVLTFIATALSVVYAPNYTSAYQTICDPRARGAAAGIAGFLASALGGAVCTYVVGTLSDLWNPRLGMESLRYALMAGMTFCLIAAVLFARSSRLIERSP
jgi:MFS family permease